MTLQSVVDYTSTIGDLCVQLSTGGYSSEPALNIANDVMTELLSQRFNWKFNRIVIPPFVTNSWQQDYAMNFANIGWLEHGVAVDVNNTALPKPIFWLECVRDLERTSAQNGRPAKVCWLPNDQMLQGEWPGAGKTYTDPIGIAQTPANPPTNILDTNGNILVLKQYGVTGNAAPAATENSPAGTEVEDGTCKWIVVDKKGQGMRLWPLPSQSAVPYQIYVIAQARPPKFTSLSQLINPIPDDYAKYFRDGFIAYCHRHSAAPMVKQRFQKERENWLQSIAQARGQGDREKDDAGFVPTSNVMQSAYVGQLGPAWPFGPYGI